MARNPAAVAYEGYCSYFDGKRDGWDMESWSELTEEERRAWWSAVLALMHELEGQPSSESD